MIRMLHAIGVLSLAAAALAVVLCVTDGRQDDSHMEQAAKPSAVERFKQAAGGRVEDTQATLSPLIQQAQAFALYLDPPVHAERTQRAVIHPTLRRSGMSAPSSEVRPVSVAARFELHGISYYRSDPRRSLALVCERDGKRRWVREGTQLGHTTIERINGDSIVYRDGAQTHVMAMAAAEVLRSYAQTTSKPALRRTDRPNQGKPAPPSVRGIRQMPPSRIAAKIGVSLSEVPFPDRSPIQTE